MWLAQWAGPMAQPVTRPAAAEQQSGAQIRRSWRHMKGRRRPAEAERRVPHRVPPRVPPRLPIHRTRLHVTMISHA